jgi:hypothetical protein
MEVGGQLHASAALPPEKERTVSIGFEAGWAPEPVWAMGSTEKFLAAGCLACRSGLDEEVKILNLTGTRTRTSRPSSP